MGLHSCWPLGSSWFCSPIRLIEVFSKMADDVTHDLRWKEFEDLGEEAVRKRLAAHIWLEETERLARQWLEL